MGMPRSITAIITSRCGSYTTPGGWTAFARRCPPGQPGRFCVEIADLRARRASPSPPWRGPLRAQVQLVRTIAVNALCRCGAPHTRLLPAVGGRVQGHRGNIRSASFGRRGGRPRRRGAGSRTGVSASKALRSARRVPFVALTGSHPRLAWLVSTDTEPEGQRVGLTMLLLVDSGLVPTALVANTEKLYSTRGVKPRTRTDPAVGDTATVPTRLVPR